MHREMETPGVAAGAGNRYAHAAAGPIDARGLTLHLHGRWHGRYGVAPCPCCQPEARRDQCALTLADGANGRLLAHCKKSGCGFRDILAAAGLAPGDYRAPDPAEIARREAEERAQAAKRAAQARAIWHEARRIEGTLAERYLRGRGITAPLPRVLRFHPECWNAAAARRLPALVAAVQGAAGPAVHRTWLREDGCGKAAVEPAKAALGSTQGGAVRLADGPDGLAVAEGIETALALASGLLRGRPAVWACLGTAGMAGLRLPSAPGKLTVATDGDAPGRAAGHHLAERASALGWEVSLLPAPEGADWCDVLVLGRASA